MKAVKGEEILLETENKVGKLEEIAKAVKEAGVNIRAISAYAVGDKAFFRIISSDNSKARSALESYGKLTVKEAVIVEVPDEVGKLYNISSNLKNSGIDLRYIYGTTFEFGKPAIIVFSSSGNDKAVEIISAL